MAKQSLHIVMLWAVLQGYGDVANSMFNSSFVMAAHMLPLLKHVSCYKKAHFFLMMDAWIGKPNLILTVSWGYGQGTK